MGKVLIIGAGGVVIRDIQDGVTAVGNPVRIVKRPPGRPMGGIA